MSVKLIAINTSEDGDMQIVEIKNFNAWIKERTEGLSPERHPVFLREVPQLWDWESMAANKYLLIRGEIVVPEPVKVVTEYKI